MDKVVLYTHPVCDLSLIIGIGRHFLHTTCQKGKRQNSHPRGKLDFSPEEPKVRDVSGSETMGGIENVLVIITTPSMRQRLSRLSMKSNRIQRTYRILLATRGIEPFSGSRHGCARGTTAPLRVDCTE